jgi:hypothetical protein
LKFRYIIYGRVVFDSVDYKGWSWRSEEMREELETKNIGLRGVKVADTRISDVDGVKKSPFSFSTIAYPIDLSWRGFNLNWFQKEEFLGLLWNL